MDVRAGGAGPGGAAAASLGPVACGDCASEWDEVRVTVAQHWLRARREAVVEDALQEAMLSMWHAERRGHRVVDRIAFANRVVWRRLLDEYRRDARTQCSVRLDEVAAGTGSDRVDWTMALRSLGFAPTANWSRLLELIAAGVRTSHGLARALGRDVTSVRESRRRLQRWLATVGRQVDVVAAERTPLFARQMGDGRRGTEVGPDAPIPPNPNTDSP